jgi:hypothetical protein
MFPITIRLAIIAAVCVGLSAQSVSPPSGGGGSTGTVTTSGSPTTNQIPKFTGSAVIGNSSLSDNGTTSGTTEQFFAPSFTTNGTGSGLYTFSGSTSGSAAIGAAAIAGTPSVLRLPTTDCTSGPCFIEAATASGGSQQLSSVSIKAPSVSVLTSGSAATYTTPVGALYLVTEGVGGGGGGSGSGTTPGAPGNGTASTFGGLSFGGGVGASTTLGGAGGTCSGTDYGFSNAGFPAVTTFTNFQAGGTGAPSPFGGMGEPTGTIPSNGGAGQANSGAGGGGAAENTTNAPGAGGGSGCAGRKLISSLSGTFTYTVGPGGAGATAGTGGFAGGNGGSGILIVTAYFQ